MDADHPDYSAHPYLDPNLFLHEPWTFRALYRQYVRIRRSDEIYNSFLNKMLWVGSRQEPLEKNQAESRIYLGQVEPYLQGLIDLLPEELQRSLVPLPEIAETNDVRRLMSLVFTKQDPRKAFEAQRKLYLAKLFFDIDQTWTIQRGPVHRRYFESLMQDNIFSHVGGERALEICFNLTADGTAIDYTVGRSKPGQECWTFHLREIDLPMDGSSRRINLYFYSCRFKKEVIAYQYRKGLETYRLRPVEIWGSLRTRRSGSILSKMIRKGASNPITIEDILGAMFIVQDLSEVETLKEFLMDNLCGPLRFRNVVDTLRRETDRDRLNRYSAPGYRVYKAEVDVLYPGKPSYIFTVELQIYTLESYLRTIHTDHYASHQRFKKRQFLLGLLPYIFPMAVYGSDPIRAYLAGERPADAPSGAVGV